MSDEKKKADVGIARREVVPYETMLMCKACRSPMRAVRTDKERRVHIYDCPSCGAEHETDQIYPRIDFAPKPIIQLH